MNSIQNAIDLNVRNIDIDNAVRAALVDDEALEAALGGLRSKSATVRENSFHIAERLSVDHPERLYDSWDFFVRLLASGNAFHRYEGLKILDSLTAADTENRFERIFDTWFGLLADAKSMIASHAALSSGTIAMNKPALIPRITAKLLDIERVLRCNQPDLVKSYVIEAFGMFFDRAEAKGEILTFVERQLTSKSPRTRKSAEQFLDSRKR